MHALELIITSLVTIAAAFIGAWFGAKFAAKRGEKTQAAFLQKIHEATNSLSAIARRLPGGQAYAAVKQAERQIAENEKSKNQTD